MDQNDAHKIELLDKCIEIQKKLFSAGSEKELLNIADSIFEELIPFDYSGLYIYNPKSQSLDLKIARGFSEEERLVAEKTAMDRHPGKVFTTGLQIYVPDTENDPNNKTVDSPRSFNVRCRLYQPIYVHEKCIGVFGVVSKRPDAFTDLQKKLFEFVCKVFGKARLNLLQVLEIKEINK